MSAVEEPEILGSGPLGLVWRSYTMDDGSVVAAGYLRGGLLGTRLGRAAVYNVTSGRHDTLTAAEAAEAVATCPLDWPLHPECERALKAISNPAGDAGVELEAEPEQEATSWRERDLEAVVDGLISGTLERPRPTIGQRTDGSGIFYAGRVNAIFGPSGDAKTWTALAVAAQEMARAEHVVWIDFEDDEIGTVGRLIDLGVAGDVIKERLHYIQPHESFSLDAEADLLTTVSHYRPSWVVIDSQGEAMAVDGVEDRDDKVARWMTMMPKRIARAGPGVTLLDHVPKAKDRDKLHAIGSQRKRASLTGLALSAEAVVEFGIGRSGRSVLTCAKDRGGHYVRGHKVAEFTMDAATTPYTWALEVPSTTTGADGFQPLVLMEKVSRYVETHPGCSQREILDGVAGKRDWVIEAVRILVSKKRIAVAEGARNAQKHTVTQPYREEEGAL